MEILDIEAHSVSFCGFKNEKVRQLNYLQEKVAETAVEIIIIRNDGLALCSFEQVDCWGM